MVKKGDEVKVKAEKHPVTQLVMTSAFKKTYSTGKTGFFGQGMDPSTGIRYQIIGAVQLG